MSSRRKIMLVFGTRPEAIKMAPLYHALSALPALFDIKLCVTAQHREMLDQALKVFDIAPDLDLDIMRPGQDLFDVTARILLGMRDVLRAERPDALLIHGDTTTTLAAAMAGFYEGVPVGHVEAGLRTHDLKAPFPEEFNRQVATRLTRWHFAPTELNRQNLLAERVPDSAITVTGNTVIDTLFWMLDRIDKDAFRREGLSRFLDASLPFAWRDRPFVLITGHRRENFGQGFLNICEALGELSALHPDVHFVYPVHLNPNVQKPVLETLAGLPNVHLLAPLDYEPFVYLLKHCHLVLTDSGGIQEEAPSLGKPVLVMRDVTERPEAIGAGTVRLVGASRERIISEVSEILRNSQTYAAMSQAHNPYGDGKACERITNVLRSF
jgi:UDP-N-acetylglucosamine 2-epimerase (non-hydrolysing)